MFRIGNSIMFYSSLLIYFNLYSPSLKVFLKSPNSTRISRLNTPPSSKLWGDRCYPQYRIED